MLIQTIVYAKHFKIPSCFFTMTPSKEREVEHNKINQDIIERTSESEKTESKGFPDEIDFKRVLG